MEWSWTLSERQWEALVEGREAVCMLHGLKITLTFYKEGGSKVLRVRATDQPPREDEPNAATRKVRL